MSELRRRGRAWLRARIAVCEAEVTLSHAAIASHTAQAAEARAEVLVERARERSDLAFRALPSVPALGLDHASHIDFLDRQVAHHESEIERHTKHLAHRVAELARERKSYRDELAQERLMRSLWDARDT